MEERGASDDYLFFVFYVLINLTFSHFVLEIHFNEFMKDQLLYIVFMREDSQENALIVGTLMGDRQISVYTRCPKKTLLR